MMTLREWILRLVATVRRSRPDRDLEEELRLHMELLAEEAQRQGHTPEEASRLGRIRAGGLAQAMEALRDQRSLPWLDDLGRDGQLAVRLMRRSPLFSMVAVASLALGIGANTAIFSLVNTLMLRPLPVQEPERLVELLSRFPGEPRTNGFSWRVYEHFRDHNHVFTDLIGLSPSRFQVGGQRFEAAPVNGEYVTGNFFQALGVPPAVGRLIAPADDQSGAAPVAVVSWSFWQSRFNHDPAVVGQRIAINGASATIIGVAPRAFFGVNIAARPDVWVPAAAELVIQQPSQRANGSLPVALVGRLKGGASLEQARAEMRVLDQWRIEQAVQAAPNLRALTIDVEPAAAGLAMMRDRFAGPLLVLTAIVGLLLLLACTNVAGMLLARGAARQREMAVRVSLGAVRSRLVRQLLTESMLLAITGGLLGVGLAYFGVEVLVGILTSGRTFVGLAGPIQIDAQMDTRVLLFALGTSIVAGILFGLAPAWHAFANAPAPYLREIGARGESRSGRLFSRSLLVAQVAVSLVILSTASLFIGHLSKLRNIGLGFDRTSVLLLTLEPAKSGYEPAQLFRPYQELLSQLEGLPGVRSATLSGVTPVHGAGASRFIKVEGFQEAPEARQRTSLNWVAPRYFETFGTPMVAGRDFRFDDEGRPPVAIVNQAMERHYFGGNAIGGRFSFEGQGRSYEVVGVVGDAKYLDLHEQAPRTVYLNPFQESRMFSHRFSVRTSVAPAALVADVRRTVGDALKAMPIGNVTTLADQVDASIVPERLVATLSAWFGALGAALVGIGLYGLLAYAVSRRINEIGVRMALGATRTDVMRMVLGSAMGLVAGGLVAGLPAAIWSQHVSARWVESLQVDSVFPTSFAATAVIVVAALSASLPAWRASRVDPSEALRHD